MSSPADSDASRRASPAPDRPSSAPPRPGGSTLLVVEDDEGVLRLMVSVLEGQGHAVLTAADGPAALALVRGREGPLELVISDVELPGFSGGKLVAQLAELRPDLGFLYVSGYPAAPGALRLEDASGAAIGFLPKPFSPSDLIRAVRAALERRRLRPRPR